MHILNYYFTPFAIILILTALFFSEPGRDVTMASFTILAAAFAVNYWLGKNTYRFLRWSRHIRALNVWMNLAVSAVLFYLLASCWAPMWLLFLAAPAASAMYMKKWQVFLMSLVSALLMLGLYIYKGAAFALTAGPEPLTFAQALSQTMANTQVWGMAATHAIFIVFFSMFTAAMAEMVVKVRDSLR